MEIDEYVDKYRKILDTLERAGIRHPTAADAILQEVAKDARMKRMHDGKQKTADTPGGYLYIYVPDGIRDRGFEVLLKKTVPESPNPRESNVFWSNKYGNFVVRAEYAEQAEQAIVRYYGKESLVKNPDWSPKPNTWQVLRPRDVKN